MPQLPSSLPSPPSPVDWTRIYHVARMQVHDTATTKVLVAGLGGFVVFNIGMCLGVFMNAPIYIAAIFIVAGFALVWLMGGSGWRDYMGRPTVLVVQVLEKRRTSSTDNSNDAPVQRCFVRVNIAEAFYLGTHGLQEAVPRSQGERWLRAQERLYRHIHEQSFTTLLCTPGGEAIAYLDDLLEPPDGPPHAALPIPEREDTHHAE